MVVQDYDCYTGTSSVIERPVLLFFAVYQNLNSEILKNKKSNNQNETKGCLKSKVLNWKMEIRKSDAQIRIEETQTK